MSLAPGSRIGVYEVLSALGAGGMGEVYRARDTRLGRDVALKIVPDIFASDPERLARFEREARTLASLNHPHIAHLHGFEESPSTDPACMRAIVMELVEGEDLAVRIARGPIPLDEALAIARQITLADDESFNRGRPVAGGYLGAPVRGFSSWTSFTQTGLDQAIEIRPPMCPRCRKRT